MAPLASKSATRSETSLTVTPTILTLKLSTIPTTRRCLSIRKIMPVFFHERSLTALHLTDRVVRHNPRDHLQGTLRSVSPATECWILTIAFDRSSELPSSFNGRMSIAEADSPLSYTDTSDSETRQPVFPGNRDIIGRGRGSPAPRANKEYSRDAPSPTSEKS